MEDFLELANARRSHHRFRNLPVDFNDVYYMIQAATVAPSAGDLQPWEFVLVSEDEIINELASHCPQQDWMINAPVLIAIVCKMEESTKHFGEHGKRWARDSCAAAAQNMLLAAEDRDLGACWITSFTHKVDEVLKVPDGKQTVAIIALGKKDDSPPDKNIEAIDRITFFNQHGSTTQFWDAHVRDWGAHFRSRMKPATKKAKETSDSIGSRVRESIKDAFGSGKQ